MRFPLAGRRAGAARPVLLVLSLLPLLLGAAWLVRGSPVDVARPQSWPVLAGLSASWLAASALARGLGDSRSLLLVIASGALALRLVFLGAELGLSDDLHRYVWEGGLVAEGVDPYAAAPAADALAGWRARWPRAFQGVNHPEVPAAYPPLVQAVHAGAVALTGGPEPPGPAELVLRSLYALCDLLVCLPLARLLRQRGRSLAALVVWAWNPWVALEFAGSGHLDSLAILCLVAALACLCAGRSNGAGRGGAGLALLALGAAVKLLPAALVPFFLRATRARARPGALLLGLLGAGFTLVPFVLATRSLPARTGLAEYAFRWESFSFAYRWIEPLFARYLEYDEGWSDPRRLARGLVLSAWVALGWWAWRRRMDPARAGGLLVGAFLLLTPTLHPWYLTWIVPFLALRPSRAWSAVLALAPLLYWPVAGWRAQGVWVEPAWLWWVLACALLAGGWLDHRRASLSGPP